MHGSHGNEGSPVVESIVNGLPGAAIYLSSDGLRIKYVNEACDFLLDPLLRGVDIIGRRLRECLPGGEDNGIFAVLREVIMTGRRAEHNELWMLDGQGDDLCADVSALPVDEGTSRRNVLVIVQDITGRKRTEEELRRSEQMLKIVIDHFPGMVYWKDRNSVYLGVNRESAIIAGFSDPSGYIGRTDYDLPWASTEADAYRADDREVMESGEAKLHITERQRRVDGSVAWLDTSKVPLRDSQGNIIGVLGTSRDITAIKKAEEALRESEERFRVMADGTPGLLWVTDENGKRMFANKYYRDFFQLPPDHEVNEKWFLAIHPDDKAEYVEKMNEALIERKPFSAQARVKRADGKWRWLESNASPRFSPTGKFLGFVGISNDITERKRAEEAYRESEARLRFYIDNAPQAVIEWDSDLRVTRWAGEAESMFGYTADETIGRPIMELNIVHPDDVSIVEGVISRLTGRNDSSKVIVMNRNITKDGRVIYCTWYNTVLKNKNGRMASVFSLIADNTARVKAEIELKRSNADLQQFAYVASHDLQEPIRMVTAYLSLLDSRYREQLDSRARMYIDYAIDGGLRAKDLIQDLLDYSRIDTRGKQFEPTAMEDVLRKAVNVLLLQINEENAVITHDPLPTILADQAQMVQVMQNLLSNAVKFHGREPPEVHVSSRDVGREWQFSVRDNGIGIDPRYSDRLFVLFQRLHTGQEYKGTGIGLAISKKIIERHGGRIWFESRPGQGTTFYFTVPKGKVI